MHDAGDDADRGRVIVAANALGTALFVLTAAFAAIVFTTPAQWVGAVTAMSLFAVGVATFLWAFFNAAQRSRAEEIAVTQVYLLLGPPTPPRVRWTMLGLLALQCATATITALARQDGPDGTPGSSLAVGVLVPMFGIGLNGLWAAFHGTFPPRRDRGAARPEDVAASPDIAGRRNDGTVEPVIGKNGDHG